MRSTADNSEASRHAFHNAFAERSANPLSDEYLRGASPKLFYDEEDRLIAGYVVNASSPLRYLEWIDGQQEKEEVDEDTCCEITCIWIDKIRATAQQRRLIYLTATLDAFRTGKATVLGGSVIESVAEFQMRGFPNLIYAGPVSLPGNPKGWIYAANRWALVTRISLLFLFESLIDLPRAMSSGRGRRTARTGR